MRTDGLARRLSCTDDNGNPVFESHGSLALIKNWGQSKFPFGAYLPGSVVRKFALTPILHTQKQVLDEKIKREKILLDSLPRLSLEILDIARTQGRVTVAEAAKITGTSRNSATASRNGSHGQDGYTMCFSLLICSSFVYNEKPYASQEPENH